MSIDQEGETAVVHKMSLEYETIKIDGMGILPRLGVLPHLPLIRFSDDLELR